MCRRKKRLSIESLSDVPISAGAARVARGSHRGGIAEKTAVPFAIALTAPSLSRRCLTLMQ